MRTPALALAAFVAGAAACGRGVTPPERGVTVWLGDRDSARIIAASTSGGAAANAAVAPAIDGPVRALLRRADGNVVALQDISSGAPPAVLLSPAGDRLAAFASTDGTGAALFGPALPWAAAEAADGKVWVTGGVAPVRYAADGEFVGLAASLGAPTHGIAALPDGRMAVSYEPYGVAIYGTDGSVVKVSPAFGTAYYGIDALAAKPDGALLVAVLRHALDFVDGIVVAARIDAGSLVAVGDPEASARFTGWLPSAIAIAGGEVLVGPGLGPLAPATCVERLSADLKTSGGCLVPGAQRGVTTMP